MSEQSKQKSESGIVRIAGRDINSSYNIEKALTQIKGIGNNLAHAIALTAERKFGISTKSAIGEISEEKITEVEKMLTNLKANGIPAYLLNRQKDLESGNDLHLLSSDLTVRVKQDVDNDIRIQTWRGHRHQYGQKVRGQRTRSTGRTGVTIGVTKKAALTKAAAQEAATEAQKKKQPGTK
ncbi:MAG: 30S ribosomal protein S13 [Candidatus Micrarchaeaceae archaeon]